MMRVLHVLDHSIPLHSGYTFRTLSLLREQRKLGWETFHITGPKQLDCHVDQEHVDGLHFFRTPVSRSSSRLPVLSELALIRQLRRRLLAVARQVQPHILHVHSPVLNALPALSVGRQLAIPVVYEVRAFWEDAAVDHGTTTEDSPRYKATRWLETRACRQANHVFTICEGLRADIVARGIPSSKVTVIPNAVDIEGFSFQRQPDPALRLRLGLGGARVIGFVGSFYSYEGLDLLLESLPGVLKRHPDARVLLVGGGPQESRLRTMAEAMGLRERVVFVGRVPHAQVQDYYDLIDVLAYPRRSMRLTELVTPLKPLEAMAQGRVLVASDVGGHKELISDGQTGFLFKADDAESLTAALSKVLASEEACSSVRTAGRAFVETDRNWTASVARYKEPYERVVSAKVR